MNLRIPGPTPVPREVAEAGAADMINHRGPEFAEMIARITERLKRVYETENDVLILTASGSGGMEAAVANHVSPGDTVLVVTVGVFGQRFLEIASAYGIQAQELAFEFGTAADANRVDEALAADPAIRAVLLTHNETSTGVTNVHLAEIARAVRDRDRLLIVDAISSLSSLPCPVDEWSWTWSSPAPRRAGWSRRASPSSRSASGHWEAQERCTTARFYFDLKRAKESSTAPDAVDAGGERPLPARSLSGPHARRGAGQHP